MAIYRTFEELPVWQAAKPLAVRIYAITEDEKFSRDFGLRDQIRRAAISISSNIAEGFERATRKELIQFLHIARGSVGEVRSQLAVAEALGYVRELDSQRLREECVKISRQLTAFIQTLRKK